MVEPLTARLVCIDPSRYCRGYSATPATARPPRIDSDIAGCLGRDTTQCRHRLPCRRIRAPGRRSPRARAEVLALAGKRAQGLWTIPAVGRTSGLENQTGARALVTGSTAVGVASSLSSAFPTYLSVDVGLAFVLLVLMFRSLPVQLKAALALVMSVGISLGTTVAVFRWGWLANLIGSTRPSRVVFILPLLLTGILSVSPWTTRSSCDRMRKEFVHGTPARKAIAVGFQHSARVVPAAAVIMICVFGAVSQGDNVVIKSIGFGLAIGVLADAYLVRMMIVPALMAIIGRHLWSLPRWLDRIMPPLDIEGQTLTRHLDEPATKEKVDSLL